MSGPIPINPVHVGGGQVFDGGAQPDVWNTLLQSLLHGTQIGVEGFRQAKQDSRSSAENEIQKAQIALQQQQLKLQQEREKRETLKQETELEGMRAQGKAMTTILTELAPHMVQSGGADQLAQLMGMPGVQGPSAPGVQPQTMQWPAPAIQQQNPAAGPLGALLHGLQGLPAEARPGFVHQAMPVVNDAIKAQAIASQQRSVENAIQAVPAEKQGRLRALYTLTDANKDLPKEVLRSLFPDFFAQNEPETVNAFTTAFRTGSFTAGQAARMVGMVLPSDVDTNTKYPLDALLGGKGMTRQTEIQSKAANFLGIMQTTAPLIDELIEKTGGVSFLGEVKKNQQPGGGFFATLKKMMVNKAISADQQQLITNMQNFGNAWRFAISGASSSDKEFEQIMNSTVEAVGDQAETKILKRNLRRVMIQGVEDIANGHQTRAGVLNRALKLSDWTPQQKAFLQQSLQDAVGYETKIKNGTAPFIPEDAPPGSAAAMQKQLDEMNALIRANTLGVRP